MHTDRILVIISCVDNISSEKKINHNGNKSKMLI